MPPEEQVYGVHASLQHMHDQRHIVQLSEEGTINEFLGEHFVHIVGAVEVPIKEVM